MDRDQFASELFKSLVGVDHRCDGAQAAVRAYALADAFAAEAENQHAQQEAKTEAERKTAKSAAMQEASDAETKATAKKEPARTR